MPRLVKQVANCVRGATAIEYGLILSLVVLALIGGITAVGGSTHGMWGNISGQVEAIEP